MKLDDADTRIFVQAGITGCIREAGPWKSSL